MLEEMKGFNKCLIISGHIKEDQGVPGRIKQIKKETNILKNAIQRKLRRITMSGNINDWEESMKSTVKGM